MYTKDLKYNSKFAIWNSLVRTHIILHKLTVPEQQIQCLVLFCLYGISEETYDKLVEKKIVASKSVIKNYKTFLKDTGLIKKIRSNNWEVCDDLKKISVGNHLEMRIKISLKDGDSK